MSSKYFIHYLKRRYEIPKNTGPFHKYRKLAKKGKVSDLFIKETFPIQKVTHRTELRQLLGFCNRRSAIVAAENVAPC